MKMKGQKRNASSQGMIKKKRLKKKGDRPSKPKVKSIRLKELKWMECQRCGAYKLNTESKGFCCGNGKERIVDLSEVPPIVLEMIREMIMNDNDLNDNVAM